MKPMTWWNEACGDATTLLKRIRKIYRLNRLVIDVFSEATSHMVSNLLIQSKVTPHESGLEESEFNEGKI